MTDAPAAADAVKVAVAVRYKELRHAEAVSRSLAVDKDLKGCVHHSEFWAEQKDLKTLRTCVSSFFDMVAVANEAVEHFDLCPPAAQQ